MNDSRCPPRRDADGNDESRELELALATLRPDAGTIDRDRLMFLAGRATVERAMTGRACLGGMPLAKWAWPSATAISAVAATVLAVLLAISHRPLVVREPPYAHDPVLRYPMPPTPYAPQPGDGALSGAPGTVPGTMVSRETAPGELADDVPVATRVDVARVDFVPRTKLPPSNYVQKRQIALSLGIEALGSGALAGAGEQPVAYRDLLEDLVNAHD